MNMKTSPNDVSNEQILEALTGVQSGLNSLSEKFDGLEQKVDGNHLELTETIQGLAQHMDERFSVVERDQTRMTTEQTRMSVDQTRMSATMVTKGYLDDKLADLKSDIIQHTRKEIEKSLR
jgi:hypothetical protein